MLMILGSIFCMNMMTSCGSIQKCGSCACLYFRMCVCGMMFMAVYMGSFLLCCVCSARSSGPSRCAPFLMIRFACLNRYGRLLGGVKLCGSLFGGMMVCISPLVPRIFCTMSANMLVVMTMYGFFLFCGCWVGDDTGVWFGLLSVAFFGFDVDVGLVVLFADLKV